MWPHFTGCIVIRSSSSVTKDSRYDVITRYVVAVSAMSACGYSVLFAYFGLVSFAVYCFINVFLWLVLLVAAYQNRHVEVTVGAILIVISFSVLCTFSLGRELGVQYLLWPCLAFSVVLKNKFLRYFLIVLVAVCYAIIELYSESVSSASSIAVVVPYLRALNLVLAISVLCGGLFLFRYVNTRLLARLQELTNKDELTGLYNRRFIMSKIEDILENRDCKLNVFIVDVDRFKNINDSFGHVVGDEVIKAIAKELQRAFPNQESCVARIGGDEFLVCDIGEFSNRSVWNEFFDRVRNIQIREADFKPSTSVGYAASVRYDTVTSLIERADQQLYLAKQYGRDQLVGL